MIKTWLALALFATAAAGPAGAAPAPCDESCLLDIAGQYMDSMSANDPAGAPAGAGLRATENGVATPLGEGLWKTARGWRYRHTFVDPVSGGIGVLATVREDGEHDAMVAIRLKVRGRAVVESELAVARQGDFSLFEPRWAAEAKPVFGAFLPADHPMSRAQLEAAARGYFDAIVSGDPRRAPMHPDANRVENGVQTTNSAGLGSPSAKEGLYRFVYMQKVRQLRFPVVDTRRGLVWAVLAFDMPKMERTLTIRGRPYEITSQGHNLPRTIFLYELFKVEDGKIRAIEAVLRNMPLGADMGWSAPVDR
jgi:hypothetical protein